MPLTGADLLEVFSPHSETVVGHVTALAVAYEPHVDEMAALITEEMGSPTSYSQFGEAFPG